MKIWLIVFSLWMALTAAIAQEPEPASLVYTHLGTFSKDVLRVHDDAYLGLDAAKLLGWSVRVNDGEADIQAEGRRLLVVVRTFGGKPYLPLMPALNQLGADAMWGSDGNRLIVTGLIRNFEVIGNTVKFDTTLAVRPKVFRLANPDRLVIDLAGGKFASAGRIAVPKEIRLGQYDPSTARIVVERPDVASVDLSLPASSRFFSLNFGDVVLSKAPATGPTPNDVIKNPLPLDPDTPQITPPDPTKLPDDPPVSKRPEDPVHPPMERPTGTAMPRLGSAQISGEGSQAMIIRFPLSGPAPMMPSPDYISPTELAITFPGVIASQSRIAPGSSFLRSVTIEPQAISGARIVLDFSRPIGYTLGLTKTHLELRLVVPRVSDGKLSGKRIVVDAGHGGTDSGARAPDKSMTEKNVTLLIAKELARELSEEGVAVIMTRADDRFISLGERAAIANRERADLFVSVHINSNATANSRSGTITFYHKNDPIGVLLAECIQSELAKVNKLPDIGIWSDTRIYKSGFSVLRNTKMPGVLLELAFINHRSDRARMADPDWRKGVATAVVRGLKVFVGDNG